MAKKILWLSRHVPLQSQLSELRWLFGDVEIVIDKNPFASADEIIERIKAVNADEIVIVAPLSLIAQLCQRGIQPLWAQMEQVDPSDPRAEVEAAGRWYRFVEFRRIIRLEMVTEPLRPQ